MNGAIEIAQGRNCLDARTPRPKSSKVMAIVVASPLTANIYDRIGAEIISKYFQVVVIDCLDWVREFDKRPIYKEVDARNIYKAASRPAFEEIVRLTSPSFVLDFVGRGKYTRQIQNTCREFGALYITQLITPAPNPFSERTLPQLLVSNPVATSYKIVRYILRQFFEDKPLPPDVALLAGIKSNGAWTETAKKKIFTAAPDYFDLRRIRDNHAIHEGSIAGLAKDNYILFIDDCLALSFDFSIGAYKPVFEANEYFSKLQAVFARLEQHFLMPVVVAAHPNGKEFQGYKGLFGRRTVLFDAVGTLSLHCRFAVTHFSSAISYPVLLRKQILLLNSRTIRNLAQGIAINYIAEQLQCVQIEMDGKVDEKDLEQLDGTSIAESCYKAYEEDYIKNVETSDANPFESLMKYLSSSA